MELSLSGKVVVVTGAASGVGRAVALRAAEAGAEGLLLVDREDCAGVAKETGGVAHICDLAGIAAPQAVGEAARAAFGRIDGLVNAAGLTTRASLTDATPDQWDSLFAVNARAPLFLMQAAQADMARRGAPGSIVNILSMNAHCGTPELAIYSATKGALATLTKNAAHAHLAQGIRVNGINLGWTLTEAEHHMQSVVLGLGPDWAEEVARGLPLGRLLTTDEAARHALWLLSDASAPQTGTITDLEQRVTGAP